jgi:hypothetical protein
MAIEAPISKFKKNNILIYIGICIIFAAWFAYDGYINEKFIQEHTNENGKADSILIFNQKSPPFFLVGAVFFGIYFYRIKGRKLLAEENELVFSGGKSIPYDAIEKINKTWFEKKGYFVITYKDKDGKETEHKISDRSYDGLENILNHLVEKIS